MTQYIDGFVHPIPRNHLNEYKHLVESISAIWKEHGAIDYKEYIGDDMKLEGTRSFSDLLDSEGDDVIIFGWVLFDSREVRDLANERVAEDPRMTELVASSNSGFNAKRMAYGGFKILA